MTRINADIHPVDLSDQHLMAEYRELPMVPASLRRSMRTRSQADIIRGIPDSFTLGKGHVTFWYNKLAFLDRRYGRLQTELITRGYEIDLTRDSGCDGFPSEFYGDYLMSSSDLSIIVARIDERISAKPGWYRHYRQPIA
jgi:deoxyribonuclease (pyrimidine dimer)